jgi:hypothetical protein
MNALIPLTLATALVEPELVAVRSFAENDKAAASRRAYGSD